MPYERGQRGLVCFKLWKGQGGGNGPSVDTRSAGALALDVMPPEPILCSFSKHSE